MFQEIQITLLLAADYSQIELRLIAEMSGDEEMKSSFLRGEDIHKSTAAKVFQVAFEKLPENKEVMQRQ